MSGLPNRDRWDGWVTFAWLLAILACIGGISVISMAGFVEVPRENSFGRLETVREPNTFVWSIGIGQAVSALMLAALFSMINSIYKNSCDQLEAVIKPKKQDIKAVAGHDHNESQQFKADEHSDTPGYVPPVSRDGLKVLSVHRASPLSGLITPGCTLVSINNEPALSELDAAKAVVKGKNKIEFLDANGLHQAYEMNMKPGPLHIKFET